MKLRIKGNSLRLRLTKSEVAQTLANGRCTDTMAWGAESKLTYGVEFAELDEVSLVHEASMLMVKIPKALGTHWARSDDEVSIRGEQTYCDASTALLIEKDWNCLAPRPNEDEYDAFRHPREETDTC